MGATAHPHPRCVPRGAFAVVYLRDEAVGCGAVRHHPGNVSDIKRMWIAESARGMGLGLSLRTTSSTWPRRRALPRCTSKRTTCCPKPLRFTERVATSKCHRSTTSHTPTGGSPSSCRADRLGMVSGDLHFRGVHGIDDARTMVRLFDAVWGGWDGATGIQDATIVALAHAGNYAEVAMIDDDPVGSALGLLRRTAGRGTALPHRRRPPPRHRARDRQSDQAEAARLVSTALDHHHDLDL